MSDILATRQAVQSSAADEAPSLVQAVWRQRWIVLACVVVLGAVGFLLSGLQEDRYTANTRIFLSASQSFDPLNQGQFVADAGRYAADQINILESGLVLEPVIDKLGLEVTPAALRENLKLTSNADSDLITVEATATDPELAAQVSDAIAAQYQAFVQQRVTERTERATAQVTVPTEVRAILAAAAVYGDGVLAVEPAVVPEGPSSPQPVRDGLVLAIVGALIAIGWALYSQSWSKRRVGPAETSAIFSAPILSEIPDRGRIAGPDEIAAAHSDPGDAYRMAAVGLDYIRGTAPGVFLVTAPHPGAGSSTTALNLAAAAADHGRRAFVIAVEDGTRPWPGDGDERPRVLLHDLTQGRVDVSQVMESREASRARFGVLRVLVVEPVQGHPVGDVQRVLDQLPDDTDLVVIDAPPLPGSSASFVLAGQVDAVVVVVDETTTPADLEELQRRCRLAGVTVAGVVRNHIRRNVRAGLGLGRKPGAPKAGRPAAAPSAPGAVTGDSTAPRGLPILTGGMPMGDGTLHAPYGQGPTVAVPHGVPHGSPQQGGPQAALQSPQGPVQAFQPSTPQPVSPQPVQAPAQPVHGQPMPQPPYQQQADLPWSSVTRLAGNGNPGNPVNGHEDDRQS